MNLLKGIHQQSASTVQVASPCRSRLRQKGQATILGMVLILLAAIVAVSVFNTGQLVTKKMQLINAADAAAYAGAVEQARIMNMMAYTNRARIANHVAVAQAVGIVSWLKYTDTFTENLSYIAYSLSWIPYVGIVLSAIGRAMQILNRGIEAIIPTVTKAMNVAIKAMDFIVGALYGLSVALGNMGAQTADIALVARSTAKANLPKAEVTALSATMGLLAIKKFNDRFFKKRKPTKGSRLHNVVMQSRDAFSKKRNWDFDINIWIVDIGFEKRGGTDLLASTRGRTDKIKYWTGMDTADFHVKVNFPRWLPFSDIDISVPLGWGAAQGDNRKRPLPGMNYGRGWASPYAGKSLDPYGGATNMWLASKAAAGSMERMGRRYNGLRAYYGIADTKDHMEGLQHDPTGKYGKYDNNDIVLTVQLALPPDSVGTTSTINKPDGMTTGRMALDDKLAGNALTAVSSAAVYFSRPHSLWPLDANQLDGDYKEYGSLFSPYWQAHLVPTTLTRRVALDAAQAAGVP